MPTRVTAQCADRAVALQATTALVLSTTMSLRELHDMTKLGAADVLEVVNAFQAHQSEDNLVSRAAFHEVMSRFVGEQAAAVRSRTKDVFNRVFDALDVNGDGSVDAAELKTGVTMLCGGEAQDRIRAAFQAHSKDGTSLGVDEATTYLESVYKVLFTINPQLARRIGSGPDRLAVNAVRRMFWSADLNDNGTISYDEFVRWYSASPHGSATALSEGFTHLGNLHGTSGARCASAARPRH